MNLSIIAEVPRVIVNRLVKLLETLSVSWSLFVLLYTVEVVLIDWKINYKLIEVKFTTIKSRRTNYFKVLIQMIINQNIEEIRISQ